MKANELRIGNLIELYRKPEHEEKSVFSVSAIDTSEDLEYCALSDGFVVNIETGITPIPLTEEWLVKFGFERRFISGVCVFAFRLGRFCLTTCERVMIDKEPIDGNIILTCWCGSMVTGYERIKNIEYVHQLQNLYHALTGEELEIKK